MKNLSFVRKNRVIVTLFFVIFCLFLGSTIAYSALNSTMRISGSSYARVESNVRITDFYVSSGDGNASYTAFSKDSVSSNVSGSVTFAVEITNYSSNFVGVKNISSSTDEVSYTIDNYNLEDRLCDDSGRCNNFSISIIYITVSGNNADFTLSLEFCDVYSVLYTNFDHINSNSYVVSGESIEVYLSGETYDGLEVYINNNEVSDYTVSNDVLYIYNISGNVEVRLLSYFEVVDGDLDTPGSIVKVKNEEFYVIDSDEESVTLFTKYNLHVGYVMSGGTLSEIENPSSRQSDKALAYIDNGSEYVGLVPFSDIDYWSSDVSTHPTYVYNSNASISSYVDEYKSFLIGLGIDVDEARLIDYYELKSLGCYSSNATKCTSAPNWVYTTTYWSGSTYGDGGKLRVVRSDGSSGYVTYSYTRLLGVRPVIVVPRDEFVEITYNGFSNEYVKHIKKSEDLVVDFSGNAPIKVDVSINNSDFDEYSYSNGILTINNVFNDVVITNNYPNVRLLNGSLDVIGSMVSIKDEEFYLMKNKDYKLTLIGKYNLYVGGVYNGDKTTAYGDEATGLQDPNMLSYTLAGNDRHGVSKFSSSTYWSSSVTLFPAYVYSSDSILYEYYEFYFKYLKELEEGIVKVRAPDADELVELGCSYENENCVDAPSWVHATTYWTGTANSSKNLWRVVYGGDEFTAVGYSGVRGVRPVVELNVSK